MYLALGQLHFFYQFHPHIPVKDTWRLLPLVEAVLSDGWRDVQPTEWFEAHAGAHRIALTRVLMVLDYRYFGGQNHLLFASAAVSLVLLLGIYSRAFNRLFGKRNSHFLFYLGLTLIWLFSPSQIFNLVNPINSSWYTALAFSVASIQLMLTGGEGLSAGRFCLALLTAALAALSNFSGLIVWLLLPIVSLVQGHSIKTSIVSVTLSALVLYLYLSGIESSVGIIVNDPDVNSAAREIWAESGALLFWLNFAWGVLRGALLYLGSPISSLSNGAGIALATLSLMLLIARGWKLISHSTQQTSGSQQLLFVAVASLCVGIALATQLGRIYIGGADALRYQTVVMLYWLNISGLLATRFRHDRQDRNLVAAGLGTALCLLLVVLPMSRIGVRESVFINQALLAEQLGKLGVYQSALYSGAYPAKLEDPQPHAALLFQRYGLAYVERQHHQGDTPSSRYGVGKCETPPTLELLDVTSTLTRARLEWSKKQSWLHRRVSISQQGQARGFVVPQLVAGSRVNDYLPGGNREWIGYLINTGAAADVFTLHYKPLAGTRYDCTDVPILPGRTRTPD